MIELKGTKYIKRNNQWYRIIPEETKPEIYLPVASHIADLLDEIARKVEP